MFGCAPEVLTEDFGNRNSELPKEFVIFFPTLLTKCATNNSNKDTYMVQKLNRQKISTLKVYRN